MKTKIIAKLIFQLQVFFFSFFLFYHQFIYKEKVHKDFLGI